MIYLAKDNYNFYPRANSSNIEYLLPKKNFSARYDNVELLSVRDMGSSYIHPLGIRLEVLNILAHSYYFSSKKNFNRAILDSNHSFTFYKKQVFSINESLNVISYLFSSSQNNNIVISINFWDVTGSILDPTSIFIVSSYEPSPVEIPIGVLNSFVRLNLSIDNIGMLVMITPKSLYNESNLDTVLKAMLTPSDIKKEDLTRQTLPNVVLYDSLKDAKKKTQAISSRMDIVITPSVKTTKDELFLLDQKRAFDVNKGFGYISGKTYVKINGVLKPVSARVILYLEKSNEKVAETFSDENGYYIFKGLSAKYDYFVLAKYPTNEFGYEVIPHKFSKEYVYDGLQVSYPTIE